MAPLQTLALALTLTLAGLVSSGASSSELIRASPAGYGILAPLIQRNDSAAISAAAGNGIYPCCEWTNSGCRPARPPLLAGRALHAAC
jgi:hypothetical protein